MNRRRLRTTLQRHEGVELRLYDDATGARLRRGDTLLGHPTIGIGRNLMAKGLTYQEARILLDHDIDAAIEVLYQKMPWFERLDDPRQEALVNMCFNLGPARLLEFSRMLRALEHRHFETAAIEALDSRWAQQVGERADEVAAAIRTGKPVEHEA